MDDFQDYGWVLQEHYGDSLQYPGAKDFSINVNVSKLLNNLGKNLSGRVTEDVALLQYVLPDVLTRYFKKKFAFADTKFAADKIQKLAHIDAEIRLNITGIVFPSYAAAQEYVTRLETLVVKKKRDALRRVDAEWDF